MLAAFGQRVLIWDRPNTGASDICFTGASESEMQADHLAGLLARARPDARDHRRRLGRRPRLAAHRGTPSRCRVEARDVVDLGRHLRTVDARGALLRRVAPRRVAGRDGSGRRASRMGRSARAQSAQPATLPRRSTRNSSSRRSNEWMRVYCPDPDATDSRARRRRARARSQCPTLIFRSGAVRSVPHARDVGAAARTHRRVAARRTAVGRHEWIDAACRGARRPRRPLRTLAAARAPVAGIRRTLNAIGAKPGNVQVTA